MTGMVSLLSAQQNLKMATQVQNGANQTISAGRIRQREGVMSEDDDMIEEGLALQAKGEEDKNGCIGYITKALDDVRAAAKEEAEAAKAKRADDAEQIEEKRKAKKAADASKAEEATSVSEDNRQLLFDNDSPTSPEVIVEIGKQRMTVGSVTTETGHINKSYTNTGTVPAVKSSTGNNQDVKA